MDEIHTVTGVRTERQMNVRGTEYEAVETRCFGWYPTLGEALESAAGNACDINEAGHYPWLVVETVSPGVYAGPRHGQERWFRWIQDGEHAGEGRYEACGPPEGIATMGGLTVSAFGMG